MRIKDAAALTDVGVQRDYNEDAVLLDPDVPILAVADGMGGPGSGDVAAGVAVEFIRQSADLLSEHAQRAIQDRSTESRLGMGGALEMVLEHIHHEVELEAERRVKTGMATTMVAALIAGDHAYVAHVGDSRAYLFRDGTLRVLTEDHTMGMLPLKQGREVPRIQEKLGGGNAGIVTRRRPVPIAPGPEVEVEYQVIHAFPRQHVVFRSS